jgi:prevent-host-death family protein
VVRLSAFDAFLDRRYSRDMSEHSLPEAEHSLSDLIDRALAGEDVVITRDGRPVVELRPLPAPADPPKSRMSPAESIAWLRANRVPTRAKTDAGELLRQVRDEWDR